MKQVAFYEAFALNLSTCEFDLWMGTATLETIKKHGLRADINHPLYGDESLAVDGWGYRAK